MYLEFYGLNEYPFRLTPDTDFLFLSSAHSRAKSYMEYTVWNRDGFVVITGDIGCGKTTLVQKLLSELDENVLVAKIFQTQLDEVEFLQAVLVEFGLNPFHAKKVELIDMLNTFLIENFLKLKQLVLIVDDAHNLGAKVLEEVRMLSSLETNKEKILHIILVGQPELNSILEEPEMEQLLQRVRLRYHIRSLSDSEIREYVLHRLRVAGARNLGLFADEVYSIISKYTGGIPRLINTLCDTALVCAYADERPTVTAAVMSTAVQELQWEPYVRRISKRRPKRSDAGNDRDVEGVLRENVKALHSLGGRLERVDTLAPLLSTIGTRMGRIESLLEAIAEALGSAPRQGSVSKQRLNNK